MNQLETVEPKKAKDNSVKSPPSGDPTQDAEKQAGQSPGGEDGLKRKLKSRHLQMIAIGGTIGTGLFIGSGGAIAKSGPAGALIAYIFVGTLVYSVMTSLGEMATYMPISGAFTAYAARFIDPSLGFAMGWIYWFSWAMTYALELTATGLIINYWAPNLSIAIFISVFWVLITIINMLPVTIYGEFEFGLSMIKVVTVLGFIIFAICIAAGAGQQGVIGFDNWKDPGAFAPYLVGDGALAKFIGFWAVLIQAGFSYQGTELVGIAAGETENPRKNVPAAIKKTFYRILFFFVVTVFCIGLLIPYTNKDLLNSSGATSAAASPFVIAAKLAGVKVLPGLINGVLLFVVISAANSNVYSGSRILLGLAIDGSAPACLKRTTKSGVPWIAILATSAFGFFAYLNLSNSGTTVFNWFLNITAVAGFISWACISWCHIAFMRALAARGTDRDTLPYKAFWEPYFAWYGLCFNVLIVWTQGFESFIPWNASQFFAAYVSLILFLVLFVGHKLIMKTTYVRSVDVDLDTDAAKDDDGSWSVEEPTTWWGRMWASFL
ncbi:uncharacterized protein L3040_008755 [Drepanopeziza brunnea f. sp. 'multigermtubi']|uniref:uncharacterized protein n=1 Tax=Drepanopeziza brunnea f. sp. 'multigermtubi' TaxID=698441 RepID=UPI0023824B83|nr:hypothetical protein L3040_008755 [Drepanopeziza brunnea f. sp. 'multigermtubi']